MDLDSYKDMEREGFLFEIQRIALQIEDLIDKYTLETKSCLWWLLDWLTMPEGHQLNVYGYNLNSRDELDELVTFAQESYKPDEPDISDLLDGLGISLN